MPKLFEFHISFLAPEEAVITISGGSVEEAEANLRLTLDQVQELQVLNVKDLGDIPDNVQVSSAEANAPADPKLLN